MQLQWLRFLQGLGGSIGMVIAFAIVKDAFSGARMGIMMSLILAVLSIDAPAPLRGHGNLLFWFPCSLAQAPGWPRPYRRNAGLRRSVCLTAFPRRVNANSA